MGYTLIKEVIELIEKFETDRHEAGEYTLDIGGFKRWVADEVEKEKSADEPDWEGKANGRSPESVINTLIVHMNRYAKTYSKSAIHDSDFSTQEDFIYLINLKAFGQMTKMELIKKNIQEKPIGMQIISRLIRHGWVAQADSPTDKRSKIIRITEAGSNALASQMSKIRKATEIVTGDLTRPEKMELIRLLGKLDRFHKPIFSRNIDNAALLDRVDNEYLQLKDEELCPRKLP